jgi:hypothetical protein
MNQICSTGSSPVYAEYGSSNKKLHSGFDTIERGHRSSHFDGSSAYFTNQTVMGTPILSAISRVSALPQKADVHPPPPRDKTLSLAIPQLSTASARSA